MFKPIESNKVYMQIISQIKERIRSGELKKGDRLPSERTMSEELGASRATVREAIRAMELMGLVHCVQGEGNFITSNIENSLIEPISMIFMLEQGNFGEINELRRALELEAVKLASNRISKASLDQLEILCRAIESDDRETIRAKADQQFHYEIAKASGNIFIINILNAAAFIIEDFIRDIRIKILSDTKGGDVMNTHHRGILEALRTGDTEKAVYFMQEHMKLIDRFMSCC
ncbi:MAG: GntR family transcriptional regulator, transcriptional repressor for pyruvate dehydrogenase complex [Clostridiales bacterium]|nr:GntR family transcriptional regulator, transcriptional repressor for pyruvate dehydrogenase complex [Clostridiales bacterium]